jgi:non-ribosomal peptide synthetase component F
VLKAGGAYVPLDPAYPQERLSYMIQDSHLQVVLTQTSLLDTLPSAVSKTLCLDTPDGIPEEATASNPAVPILPDHLAYIIYTSGSTGLPKGIAMPHRALLNLLHWQNAHSSPPQKVRTLQFTS